MPRSEPSTLEELLRSLLAAERASPGGTVSVRELLNAAGRRSFGPLLLVPALVVVSPLSGIPGVPTGAAIVVVLVAGQLLLGRECFWLPGWLLRRELSRSKVDKALKFLQKPARWIDKLMKKRLTILTQGASVYVIGALSLLLALLMPPLEIVPFASTVIGAVLSTFGLALIARDGLLVTAGLALCVAAGAWAGLRAF